MFFNALDVPALELPPGMDMIPEDVQVFLKRVIVVQYLWRDLEKFSRTGAVLRLPDVSLSHALVIPNDWY